MKRFGLFLKEHNLKQLCLLLGVVSIWVYTHPYKGIYHDARLYAVQALSHLYPDNYSKDLFFLYGSQDDFTIFSSFYASVIDLLGLNTSTIVLLLLGYLAWITGAYSLSRSILNGRYFWFFLILIVSIPGKYGNFMLSYGEPFLTARIYSEAFVLHALSFLIREKPINTSICIFLSAILHPLMAAGGILFCMIYSIKSKMNLLYLLLAGFLITCSFYYLNFGPFLNLFRTMDEPWYSLSHTRNSIAFIETWPSYSFSNIFFDLSIIGSCIISYHGKERRILSTAFLTGITCLTLSWFFADILRNVFFIQIQLWRGLWITHLFSNLAVIYLFKFLWKVSILNRIIILCYLTAWLTMIPFGGGFLALLIFFVHFYFERFNSGDIKITDNALYLFFIPPLLSGIYYLIIYLKATEYVLNSKSGIKSNHVFIQQYLTNTGIILVILFLFIVYINEIYVKFYTTLLLLSIATISTITVISKWDQRTEWKKFVESEHENKDIPFKGLIPQDAVVSWPNFFPREDDSVSTVWFLLRRSNYLDLVQGAGIIFSKKTAFEYSDRAKQMLSLNFIEADYLNNKQQSFKEPPIASIYGINSICQDSDLDFIVYFEDLGINALDRYYNSFLDRSFYLYNCKDLKK